MRSCFRLGVVAAAVLALPLLVRAQDDSPPLGDVARQSRLQKQQKDAQPSSDSKNTAGKNATATGKDTSDKDASASEASAPPSNQDATAPPPKTKHVFTNDEIPSRSAPAGYRPTNQRPQYWNQNYNQPGYGQRDNDSQKLPAQYWTNAIQAQKRSIANLQNEIDRVSSSIHYAGNCISSCVEWNLRQRQRENQVEGMKAQLQQAQQQLEQTQEACRKQGYGSSVYDP